MIRYAIYYAPPAGSALARFGAATIGYDPETGDDQPVPPDLPVRAELWRDWTAEPRRYGFHGTLKAPFALADGLAEEDLVAAAAQFAAVTAAIDLPALPVELLGRFVAFTPAGPAPVLAGLAEACLLAFEPWRAPLTEADRARRLAANLSPRQREHLDRYGYPYVLDEFRFHLTLTGALPEEARRPVRDALRDAAREVPPETRIGEVALFRQADRGGRFRVLRRFALAG